MNSRSILLLVVVLSSSLGLTSMLLAIQSSNDVSLADTRLHSMMKPAYQDFILTTPREAFSSSVNDDIIPIDITQLPTFWDNISRFNDVSLNVTKITTENITYSEEDGSGTVLLNKTELYYTSHVNGNLTVRVFAAIVKPQETRPPKSATGVVIIHGLGGSHRSALPLAKRFAARGMITVSIDLPGHGGNSTGTRTISADAFVQEDPKKSLMYHDVIATYRAITLLRSIPEVDPSKVILTGGSFGGVMTFLTSALDDRISVAIPLIATGAWEPSALAGSFLSALIPEDVSFTSPRLETFIQNFDPLRYAAHISIPILMAIGTKDVFFIPESANKTFSIIPSNNKNLLLLPNVQHDIDERFVTTAEKWIEYYVNGDPAARPPNQDVKITKKPSLSGEQLEVEISITSVSPIMRVDLAVHEKVPGYSWFIKSMDNLGNNTFKATWNAPIHGQNVQFFIVIYLESGAVYSTVLWEVHLNSTLAFAFWSILMSILIIPPGTFLYHNIRMFYRLDPDKRRKYIQYRGSMHFFPFLFQVLLLFSMFLVPWYSISIEGFSTLNWTLWQFLDFFFYFDPLPWLLMFYAITTTTGIILEPKKTVFLTPIVPFAFFFLGLLTIGFEGIGLGLYLALTAVIFQVGIVGTLIYKSRNSMPSDNESRVDTVTLEQRNETSNQEQAANSRIEQEKEENDEKE